MDTSIMYPLYAVVGLLGVTAVAVGLYAFARNEKRTALLDDTKDQTKELLKRRGDVVDLVAIFERKGLTWRDAMDTLRFEFRGGLEGEEKEHASR